MTQENIYMEKSFRGLYLDCSNSLQAWEQINEYILLKEEELKSKGFGRDGNASISYDNFIYIRQAWIDPEFDFGRMFGYRIQKWTHLINNYVDLNYLDILKQDILYREGRRQRVYNVTKHFSNNHDNGKDCLISLTFSRRLETDIPVLIFHTRATEVTKRLLIDFLLVQRMGEYIYGTEQSFSIIMYCPMAYLNVEAFTMYHTHRSIKKLLKPYKDNLQPFQQRVMKILNKFLTCKPEDISYKSHRRAVKQLQVDENGHPLSGNKPMKVGQLFLESKKILDYPPDCITELQRKDFRKGLRNKS